MLSLPGVPIVYFYSLFGLRGDRAAAETSGTARRINRQKLGRAAARSGNWPIPTRYARAWSTACDCYSNCVVCMLHLRHRHCIVCSI